MLHIRVQNEIIPVQMIQWATLSLWRMKTWDDYAVCVLDVGLLTLDRVLRTPPMRKHAWALARDGFLLGFTLPSHS